jgi:2-dehydro-3-deoxy-D-arabinonate dehydratase
MRIVRYLTHGRKAPEVGVELDDGVRKLDVPTVGDLLTRPLAEIRKLAEQAAGTPAEASGTVLLSPIDGRTEVWAAGVTYNRSRQARMEESATADVYDLVYDSDRPELFFKGAAWRTVTHQEPIGVRADSPLNVPEPELALIVNRYAEIVGYVVCNDVSSRSIEGENPLYLPQAKVYAGACSLSNGIRPVWEVPAADELGIELTIERNGATVWHGSTSTRQMRRSPRELVGFLYRAEQFPEGAVLSTGTGIVPEMEFTLQEADQVTIGIQDVGVLSNVVAVGLPHFGWLATRDAQDPSVAIRNED